MRPTAQELQDPLVEPLTVAGLARVEKRTVHHFREPARPRPILFRSSPAGVGEPRLRDFHALPARPPARAQLDQFRQVPIRYPTGESPFSGDSSTQRARMFGASVPHCMSSVWEVT